MLMRRHLLLLWMLCLGLVVFLFGLRRSQDFKPNVRQGFSVLLQPIIIPLLIYDSLIEPFVVYIAAGFHGSYGNFYTNYVLSLRGIGQGPVWFIELLLFFVVFYAL